MQIELTDTDAPEIRAAISARLAAHTAATLGQSPDRHTLAALLHDPASEAGGDAGGAIRGGLWGTVRFGWMNLEFAYLPPDARGRGTGAALLAAMERAAVALGCRGVRTGSFSFQAPGFYVRRGYIDYAHLEDHPPGHTDVSLYKASGLGAGDRGHAVLHNPDPAIRQALRTLLLAHNEAQAGKADHRPLAVVLRGADGGIEGGLAGYTGRSWLTVEQFALPDSARGAGIGTRLLTLAHDEARARGMIGARLGTASYQARPFYEKLGYAAYGEIPNYQPGGHSRFVMARRFQPGLS